MVELDLVSNWISLMQVVIVHKFWYPAVFRPIKEVKLSLIKFRLIKDPKKCPYSKSFDLIIAFQGRYKGVECQWLLSRMHLLVSH